MKDYKLNLRYFLRKVRENKAEKTPLMFLISCNGKQAQRSTGISISPDKWNGEKQIIKGNTKQEALWNKELNELKHKITDYALNLQFKKEEISLDKILFEFYGVIKKKEEILTCGSLTDLATEYFDKLVPTKNSLEYHKRNARIFKEFLKDFWKTPDIEPKEIKGSKIYDDLVFYLTKQKKYDYYYASKIISHIKRIFEYGVMEDLINKNPLYGYSLKKRTQKEIVYLTESELLKIANYQFFSEPLKKVQDLFIFQSHTGFAYIDLMNLKSDNFRTGEKGETFFYGTRHKSNSVFIVPLLPQAKEILAKYGNKPENLPRITNQKYNFYLKEVCKVVGITKKIGTHTARKTFSTLALNVWDIPIETVSKMLGHSTIGMTQKYYAKIGDSKVLKDTKHIINPESIIFKPTETDLKFYSK